MTRFMAHMYSGTSKFFKDRIGILLFLLLGIGGQIFVFFLPDPLLRLAPQIPVLSPRYWPGSETYVKLFISDPSALWKEKRSFYTSLLLNRNTEFEPPTIEQTAVWYSQTELAAAAWNQLDTEIYKGQSIVARNTDPGKPASILFCLLGEQPSPRNCTYLAYWGHWYTEIKFLSLIEENLPMSEIQRLTTRVDRQLMSAPEEPCYGFLCTGR